MLRKMCSSFPGKVDEISGIALDNFESNCLKSRAFFLSHAHADHTQGFYSQEFLNVLQPEINIYMSELTKDIVLSVETIDNKHRKKLASHIKVLELGSSNITLPNLFEFEEEYVTITTLPASHCYGSVMFLFKTNKKTVLYTGDFRMSTTDVKGYQHFHKANKEPIIIDALYVDTTFISKEYSEFPKRSHCVNEISKILTVWFDKDSKNRVAFSTGARYGYEMLYEGISENLNMKIFVADNRLKVYRKHPRLCDVFTNELSSVKLHICRNNQEWFHDHTSCGISTKEFMPNYLFIRVSALAWTDFDLENSSIEKVSDNRINVCFPTHCSRNELLYFINYLSPLKIVGFPNKYMEDMSPAITSSATPFKPSPAKMKKITPSPLDVTPKTDKKVDTSVIRKIFDDTD